MRQKKETVISGLQLWSRIFTAVYTGRGSLLFEFPLLLLLLDAMRGSRDYYEIMN